MARLISTLSVAMTVAALCLACRCEECSENEHRVPLVTYNLIVPHNVTMERLESSDVLTALSVGNISGAAMYMLSFQKDDAVPVIPFSVVDFDSGDAKRGLLDASKFLEDWANLSSAAGPPTGNKFAMPGFAASAQCVKDNAKEALEATDSDVAPNAAIMFHGVSHMLIVDIWSVELHEETVEMMLRVIPEPIYTPQGKCHVTQDMSDPHYHHQNSTCLHTLTDHVLVSESIAAGENLGATFFIKLFGGLAAAFGSFRG